jgi:hypothetical protein
MPDLEDRFRKLDAVRAPDLWPDITTREPGRPEPRRPRGQAVAILAAFAVLVGAVAWLAVSLAGSGHRPGPGGTTGAVSPSSVPPSPVPASVTGLSTDGSVRCTASVDSVSVDPGATVIVRFAVENVSSAPVEIGAVSQVLVDDANGNQVYDSLQAGVPVFGGAQRAERLAPGDRLDLPTSGQVPVPIRWPGSLTVHPVCPAPQGDRAGALRLPPLGIQVTNPGPAPAPDESVSRALDAFTPLLARCRPQADAGPVTGEIGPLPGIEAPALDARCEATVQAEPGFDVVAVTFVSPPDAQVPDVPDPLEAGRPPLPTGSSLVEVWRAIVVVSRHGAFVVEPPQFEFGVPGITGTVTVAFADGHWAETAETTCSSGALNGSGDGVVLFAPAPCPSPALQGPTATGSGSAR